MIRKRCFNRGAAFSFIFAALASAPSIVSAHDFTGNYDDPNHPNCLRKIAMFSGDTANIFGTDGNPGCPPDGSGEKWHLVGKVDGDSILVDFSPKGGPEDLEGVWESTPVPGIRWPDGNIWSFKPVF